MAVFKELSFLKTWIKLLVWSSFKTRIVECCIFNADKKSSLLGFQILINRKSLRGSAFLIHPRYNRGRFYHFKSLSAYNYRSNFILVWPSLQTRTIFII